MLSLLLILVSDPATTLTAAPAPAPETPVALLDHRVPAVAQCSPNRLQRIEQPAASASDLRNDLMFRPGDEVRRYLLLDRTVRGCPAPISYAVPYPRAAEPHRAPADPVRPTPVP